MTAKELFTYLTQDAGFDEATAKAVMAAAENEKVSKRAADFVQKKEYEDLERRAAQLELSYNGTNDKPGALSYQQWYEKNFAAVQKLQADVLKYQERFGSLDEAPPEDKGKGKGVQYNPEDVQRIVNETIQQNYAPRWAELLTNTGAIVQKHMRAGRKADIDFKKLEEIAAKKNGDLMAAYDEYDAPEREAAAKAATDAEIKRRVDEELAKARTNQFFPAGADATPSGSSNVSPLSRAKADQKYDRSKVIESAVTGKYEEAVH